MHNTIILPIIETVRGFWKTDLQVRVSINDLLVWVVVNKTLISTKGLEAIIVDDSENNYVTVILPGTVLDGQKSYRVRKTYLL